METKGIKQASDEIRPSGFLDYRLYLATLYNWMKQERETYSYQKFSEDLGFGPTTTMHQVVSGRRPLTLKGADKVVRALELKGMERRFLLALIEYGNTPSSKRRDELFEKMLELKGDALPTPMDKDVLEYFSEWYHPVIRELVGTESFRNDPAWIAKRVVPRLRPEQIKESLRLLERLGLIVHDQRRSRLVQTQKRVSTGHRVKNMALVRYHQQMIEHAKESLTRFSGPERDVSALTLSVDSDAAERLKAMIHAFQVQLLDEAERSAGDEIVQVNIQLFPFTDPKPGKKERP